MDKKGGLTKSLVVAGTVLVWLPIVAPFAFSIPGLLGREVFQIDYLMPAELFPVALVAGALLLWAALRARSRVALVGWGFGLMVAMLVGGMVLAQVTGLASGATEPAGAPLLAVQAALAVYALMLVELGVAGILLGRDVFVR
jgi:hypothetical protein